MSHWLPLTARGAGKCSLSIVYFVFQNKSRVRRRRKGKWLLEWQLAISVAPASVFDIVKASPDIEEVYDFSVCTLALEWVAENKLDVAFLNFKPILLKAF